MEEKVDLHQVMEQKSAQKQKLIKELRASSSQLSQLQAELDAAMPKGGGSKMNPGRIQERIDKLEFQIATAAYTPAQEKDLVRQVSLLKKEFDIAAKDSKEWAVVRELRQKLRNGRQERKEIRKNLDALSLELDALYSKIIEKGKQRVEDRAVRQKKREEYKEREQKREEYRKQRDAERQEIAPFMKEVDTFVSLEDIAEVKKKPAKE
jgi:uncharacterized coiled-coil DUF342 family protein